MGTGKLPRRLRDLSKKKNITLSLQPSGVALIWVSLGLLIGGAFFTGQMLLLGALGIALLPLCKWLARAQLSGLTFSRKLPRRVFSGQGFEIEVTIRNANHFLDAGDLFLSDPMMDAASNPVPLPSLGSGKDHNMVWTGRLFQRGANRQDRITATSRWPLGIFEARLETAFQTGNQQETDVLVVPRPLIPPFLEEPPGQLKRDSAFFSSIVPDAPSEFRYLREFQSGDTIRSIHWPGSTRSGTLQVKEYDPPTPDPGRYGLLVHSYHPPGEVIRNDCFEMMLRIATGLVLTFQKQHIPFLFSTSFGENGIILSPAGARAAGALDHLARAPVSFTTELDLAFTSLSKMASCDQVFVLGSAPGATWKNTAKAILPSCNIIDPEHASLGFSPYRQPLFRKAAAS